MSVYTKKLNKIVYHLATFNEPLTKESITRLPAHVIEEPAPETSAENADAQRENYSGVH